MTNKDSSVPDTKNKIFKIGKDGTTANEWYVDSEATTHMTSSREFYSTFKDISEKIYLVDESFATSEGIGDGFLDCKNSCQGRALHAKARGKFDVSQETCK